jgi:peroxiredoxin
MKGWIRLAGFMVLAFATPLSSSTAPFKPPKIGAMAPDFELTLIDGTRLSLADMRGEVVVLNFWATCCGPCKTELPILDSYYYLQQQHGLKVFAITTLDSVPLAQLKNLFAAMSIPSVRKIKGPYGPLTGVLTNYVIDRSGRLRYAKSGAFNLDSLNDLLVPLLQERPPARIARCLVPAFDGAD